MVEKLIRKNLKAQDEVTERIKSEADKLLEGVRLTSLDTVLDELNSIGSAFAQSYEQEIQGAALDGMELAEAIERAAGVDGKEQA